MKNTIIITFIATLLAAVAFYGLSSLIESISAKSAILVYSYSSGNLSGGTIHTISFFNKGNKVAEKVSCSISFSEGDIVNCGYQPSPDTSGIKATTSETTDPVSGKTNKYEVEIDYLKPGQSGSIFAKTEGYYIPVCDLHGHKPDNSIIEGSKLKTAISNSKMPWYNRELPAYLFPALLIPIIITGVYFTHQYDIKQFQKNNSPKKPKGSKTKAKS